MLFKIFLFDIFMKMYVENYVMCRVFFYLKDNFVLMVELYLLSFFIYLMIIILVVLCCWIRFYLNIKLGLYFFDSVYR